MRRGEWAVDQHLLMKQSISSVIKTSKLRALGVSANAIVDRTAGGPWQRILPGIVLLHNGQPTRAQRNIAAVMYAGGEAMLSGRAGLALHGFSASTLPTETLVLLPQKNHRKDVSFVVVERTWRVPDPVMRMNLPVAPLDRCLLDAARRNPDLRACTALVSDVIQRGQVDALSLLVELDAGCGRGSAVPRKVLRELLGGAHSVAEVDAQRLHARSGLPPSTRNVDLFSENGAFLGNTDNFWGDVGLVHEIDSFRHHASPADYTKTVERRTVMQGAGLIVVTHVPNTLLTQPERVIGDLQRAYAQALERPRPTVQAVSRDFGHREAS